jgi:Tetratricopeptide repeat
MRQSLASRIVLVLCTLCMTAVGQTLTLEPSPSDLKALLREALVAFDRGTQLLGAAPDEAYTEFASARDKFQAVIDSGVENGPLYYDLGNAHLRLGAIGKAIAAYRKAARLMPGDGRIESNLRFARSLRRDQIETSGERELVRTVFFWHYEIPMRRRLTMALTCFGLFWFVLTLRALVTRLRLRYSAMITLVSWMSLGTSVAIDWPRHHGFTEGVLVADDVIVRKGNGDGYAPQFQEALHEGVEFTLISDRGGWVNIELADGSTGWVRRREVELF